MLKDKRELFIEFTPIDKENIESDIYPYFKYKSDRCEEIFFIDGLGFFSLVYFETQQCYHIDCFLFSSINPNNDIKKLFKFQFFIHFIEQVKKYIKKISRNIFISDENFAFLNYIYGDFSKLILEKPNIISYSISIDSISHTFEDIQHIGFSLTKALNSLIEESEIENITHYNFPKYFNKLIIENISTLNIYYEQLYHNLNNDEICLEKCYFLDKIQSDFENDSGFSISNNDKKVQTENTIDIELPF